MSRATQKLDRATRKQLVERLNRDAARLARQFGLRYRHVEAERAGVKSRYGACFEDGTIKIRLVHAVTGAPLQYSSLVDTLCHELAHLKFWHHGPRFQAYYRQILAHARREGIYRPRPAAGRSSAATLGPRASGSSQGAGDHQMPARFAASRRVPPQELPSRGHPEQLSLFGPAR